MPPASQERASQAPPSNATDAVLKPSEPVPADAREVQGIDFDDYAQRSITVEELVGGYARMGFQATAIGEAVRIVNDMVSAFSLFRPRMEILGLGAVGARAAGASRLSPCPKPKHFSRKEPCLPAKPVLVMRLMFLF